MSNLAQYRLSIGLFSLGLLWVVSEVVGDGDKPGPLDVATKAIVHRLNSPGRGADGRTDPGYDLAVSQSDAADPQAGVGEAAPSQDATPGGAAESVPPMAHAKPEAADQQLAPPDVGIIHK